MLVYPYVMLFFVGLRQLVRVYVRLIVVQKSKIRVPFMFMKTVQDSISESEK